MFINTGGRTDIACYYSEWLMNRIQEGYALSRNPLFPQKISRLRLDPHVVDAILFCSKNPQPVLGRLEEIRRRGFRILFYVTITSYGVDLEPRVPPWHEVADAFRVLSGMLGRDCVFWRYDPVLLTSRYTVEHHLAAFEEMAAVLARYTSVCIFSFVETYRKLERTFPVLRPVSEADKAILLRGFSDTARRFGLHLQTCGDSNYYTLYGIGGSACLSRQCVEKALGRRLKKVNGRASRSGCGCLPSQDIGAYDSCPSGCRYCYATSDMGLALRNWHGHDPSAPLLIGHVKEEDSVIDARQNSFLLPEERRLSLLM